MSGLFDRDRKFHPMDKSVAEAAVTIRKATSLADLREWLCHERHHMQRRTVVNAIAGRIRKIEKRLNHE